MIGSAILHILSNVKDANVYGFVRKNRFFKNISKLPLKILLICIKK